MHRAIILALSLAACLANAERDKEHSLIQSPSGVALSKTDQGPDAAVGPEAMAAAEADAIIQCAKAGFAEYIAMTLFVIIGCGSAMGVANKEGYAWVLQVALTFGFAITALAYTVGAYSGGQINCAVTFGLWLAGQVSSTQAVVNVICQLLGSVTGACILTVMYPKGKDETGGLGSNGVSEGFTKTAAVVGEVMMTFLLMFVVLQTAVNPLSEGNRALACIAIGMAVFLAHSVLIPIDGCSINPTRSFGPAVVAKFVRGVEQNTFQDMWIFWAGPLIGAGLAAGTYALML